MTKESFKLVSHSEDLNLRFSRQLCEQIKPWAWFLKAESFSKDLWLRDVYMLWQRRSLVDQKAVAMMCGYLPVMQSWCGSRCFALRSGTLGWCDRSSW